MAGLGFAAAHEMLSLKLGLHPLQHLRLRQNPFSIFFNDLRSGAVISDPERLAPCCPALDGYRVVGDSGPPPVPDLRTHQSFLYRWALKPSGETGRPVAQSGSAIISASNSLSSRSSSASAPTSSWTESTTSKPLRSTFRQPLTMMSRAMACTNVWNRSPP